MVEVDWLSVKYVLERLLENVRDAETELCSLRFFEGVRELADNVEVFLKEMIKDVERRAKEQEGFSPSFSFETGEEVGGEVEGEVVAERVAEITEEERMREELPPRGYGLTAGTAARSVEERRMGHPRTEEERRERHRTLFGV